MGSISVGELKVVLDNVSDDYEVIMEIDEKTIAYIDGIKIDDDWQEIRLIHR